MRTATAERLMLQSIASAIVYSVLTMGVIALAARLHDAAVFVDIMFGATVSFAVPFQVGKAAALRRVMSMLEQGYPDRDKSDEL
jgi:hypothetical protein